MRLTPLKLTILIYGGITALFDIGFLIFMLTYGVGAVMGKLFVIPAFYIVAIVGIALNGILFLASIIYFAIKKVAHK